MQRSFKSNLTKILSILSLLAIIFFSLSATSVFASNGNQEDAELPDQVLFLAAQCAVDYTIVTDFGTSARVELVITNASGADINGWTLAWDFPNDQSITVINNAVLNQSGQSVSLTNDGLNGAIPDGSSITDVSFDYSYSEAHAVPAQFTLNGAACDNSAFVGHSPYSNFESMTGLLTSAVSETISAGTWLDPLYPTQLGY